MLLFRSSLFCLIILYLSKIFDPVGSWEESADSVVSYFFLDDDVDTMCWLPEKNDECAPSITIVDCVSPSLNMYVVWLVLVLFL
jgi:hypothetical protein